MPKSYFSIYSALAADLLIAATKFIAGIFTNSSSMISEGVHSLIDTINEVLLIYGLRLSKKPADAARPFGYGKELYFWSFIVSILIFGLGGGISIYQGILHILHPNPPGDPLWNYVVLGCSALFEGSSLVIAVRAFNQARGTDSWWHAIVNSKDPATFLVLFEDSAAVIGLAIVAVLMFVGHRYNMPGSDGIASVLVGLLLVLASMILARESRSLLMGEGISKHRRVQIKALVEKDPAVCAMRYLFSMYQSPKEVLVMLIVDFLPDLDTEDITNAIDRMRAAIQKDHQLIRFIIIQPESESHVSQDAWLQGQARLQERMRS